MKQIWKTLSNFEQLLVQVIDILNFFEKFSAQRGWGGWGNVEMLTTWPLTVDNMLILWAPLNVAPTCWTLFEVLNWVQRLSQARGGAVAWLHPYYILHTFRTHAYCTQVWGGTSGWWWAKSKRPVQGSRAMPAARTLSGFAMWLD